MIGRRSLMTKSGKSWEREFIALGEFGNLKKVSQKSDPVIGGKNGVTTNSYE